MNANAIKITESTEIKTMTVSELLTAQDIGDIATPDIQRPAGVWNAEQCAKLEDTISRGWGIGTISLVEIVKDGKTLRLLVDGLQRMTALRTLIGGKSNSSEVHAVEIVLDFDSIVHGLYLLSH